jgi:hypothetical protein
LVRCLESWSRGVYSFRLFFDGIPQWFEFNIAGDFVSVDDEIEGEKFNLRTEKVVSNFYENKIAEGKEKEKTKVCADDEEYLPLTEPIFSVKSLEGYGRYTLEEFRGHSGYRTVVSQISDHFGRFDEDWISRI